MDIFYQTTEERMNNIINVINTRLKYKIKAIYKEFTVLKNKFRK